MKLTPPFNEVMFGSGLDSSKEKKFSFNYYSQYLHSLDQHKNITNRIFSDERELVERNIREKM